MSKTLAQTVPVLLRMEMARQDLTSRALAERLGVSEMWVYRRLKGRSQITLDDLDRLSAHLNLKTSLDLEPAA